MKDDSKRYRYYEILIMIGCCLLYGTTAGIGSNCKGIFYSVVAEDLGVSLPKVTMYTTYYGIAAAITIPLSTRLFSKLSARVWLSVLVGIYGITEFLMGSIRSTLTLNFLGAFQGISGGFVALYPLQHIIGNWFPNRKGMLMGIAGMSSGILGMILNPIATNWISVYGWRTAYRILGILMLILGWTATFFMLYKSPEEKGFTVKRDNREYSVAKQHSKKDAGLPVLVMFVLFLVLVDLIISFPQILPSFAKSIGKTAVFGASLVSAAMFGNIIFKLLIGYLNDRIGARFTTVVAAMPIMLASLVMAFSHNEVFLLAAAFCGGSVLSIYAIQFPLLFKEVCSQKQFDRYYSYTCSINSVLGAYSATALALLYSTANSYRPVMICCSAAMMITCVICLLFEVKYRMEKRGTSEEKPAAL